jgi:hypothetical protein
MDFDEYVTARRITLVRVAALLGCPEEQATGLVSGVLARSSREITRADHPDPEVYRALMVALQQSRDSWPAESLPPQDHRNAPGLAVRRDLATLDPTRRGCVVLLHQGDLTLTETAEALRTKPAAVRTADIEARTRLGSPDMDQARALLQLAAETVEVQPTGPISADPPARRWPWAAAAAGAVLLATSAYVLTRPAAPPKDDALDADQIPSLFGYTQDEATSLLETRGLKVTLTSAQACEPVGRVLDSKPPTGSRFQRGESVTVFVASPGGSDCEAQFGARSDAWRFIDYATGRGPAPDFHDHVYLVINGGVPVSVTAAQARASASWGDLSAMSELREAVQQVVFQPDGSYDTPDLDVTTRIPAAGVCGVRRPSGAGTRTALELVVRVSGSERCPLTVDLYRTGDGIDAIVLYTAKASGRQRLLSPPPWVKSPRG